MSGQTGRYSRVSRRIWNDERVRGLSKPNPCAQFLFLRLLTGPELTCIPGLFQAWESGLSESIGWPLKGFREAFTELSRNGLAYASWEHGLVWIPKSIRHNEPSNPNMVKGWADVWAELPDCSLRDKAISSLLEWVESKGEQYRAAFVNGLPNGLINRIGNGMPNQEQEQDQDQDQEQEQEFVAQPKSKPSAKGSRETELPADWEPSEAHRKFAADNGIDLALELMKFKGHFEGRKVLSWNGRFSTWLGNALGFARERGTSNGSARHDKPPRQPSAQGGFGAAFLAEAAK